MSEPAAFSERQEVEIKVRSGEVFGVELATVVFIDNFFEDKVKAQVRIRTAVEILTNALPLAEITATDRSVSIPDTREPVAGKAGVSLVPRKTIESLIGQAELQRTLEKMAKEKPNDGPVLPAQNP